LFPPEIGSGHEKTGRKTQSEFSPGAWLVLDPSNPQIGKSDPSANTLVLDLNEGDGSVPSIHIYSALNAMICTSIF
jgi:hypothetical protein